jgi:hypothetical protein
MDSYNSSLEHKTIEDEIININYWKEIYKDISEILKNLHGIVIVTHNSIEFTEIIGLLNKTRPDHFHNVLYISLIRSYDFMRLALDKKPIDNKKITFIDCVSGYAFPSEDNIDDCYYHKPPSNLEQIKEIIRFGIEKCNPDIIVIDSLSQFINFSRPTESEISDLYKFLQTLRSSSLNIIQDTFLLLYDTKLGIMQNLPKFATDLILKIEILKEEPRWKD